MARKRSFLPSPATLASTLALAALVACESPPTAPDTLTPVGLASSFAPSAKPPSKRPSKPPPEQDSFTDFLDAYDTSRWMKADGWTNGPPFDNAWSAENVVFQGGEMVLRLDDVARLGEPYSSGAYQTLGFHGYGCYEASFMPVPEPGVVTSFFTFAGPFDDGGNAQHNEIDVEFVGKFVAGEGTEIQFNFFRNDDSYASRNEHMHTLPFDPTAGFNRYGFRWMSTGIEWYVNGEKVYAVDDTPENPTPKASESLQKIMMNLWPVDETATSWAGEFVYPGQPLEARYQWVRYIRGEDCDLSQGLDEPDPPQPPDDPLGLTISDISLTLASRNTQVIARVSLMDATGGAASGATVTGEWSGVITKGDLSRDTGSDGIATFYSARAKESGDVTFCVTGVTRSGSVYYPPDDLETCVSIVK